MASAQTLPVVGARGKAAAMGSQKLRRAREAGLSAPQLSGGEWGKLDLKFQIVFLLLKN